MLTFKQRFIYIIERLINRDIERIGHNSFVITAKEDRTNAWFSYAAQIKSIIEKHKINLVIDVGANEGQFAKRLRALYAGDILSFEPVTPIFNKLANTASTDPKWHVFKTALGSDASTKIINISDSTVFSSLLKVNDYCIRYFGDQAQSKNTEAVSVRRLDELLINIIPDIESRRIFLKMDTQGYDMEVFKGLGNSLKHIIALQSEISLISIYEGMPHWTESISFYEKSGFRVVGMFPVNWDSAGVIEYDCLMTSV